MDEKIAEVLDWQEYTVCADSNCQHNSHPAGSAYPVFKQQPVSVETEQLSNSTETVYTFANGLKMTEVDRGQTWNDYTFQEV